MPWMEEIIARVIREPVLPGLKSASLCISPAAVHNGCLARELALDMLLSWHPTLAEGNLLLGCRSEKQRGMWPSCTTSSSLLQRRRSMSTSMTSGAWRSTA